MEEEKKKGLFSEETLEKLRKANNGIVLVAICSQNRWLILFSMLFWGFLLTVLIKRDMSEHKVSVATVVYGVLFLGILGFCLYTLFH